MNSSPVYVHVDRAADAVIHVAGPVMHVAADAVMHVAADPWMQGRCSWKCGSDSGQHLPTSGT